MAGKQTRRSRGTGSIYYSEADDRWEAKLDLGVDPATGRRRVRKVTGRTKSAVTRKLAELERANADGVDLSGAPITVGQLATDWLTKDAAQRQEVSTCSRTRDVVERHIIPALGTILVTKLTPDDVEAWLEAESRAGKGRARRTLAGYRLILAAILDRALRRRLVAWNVARVASVPGATAPDKPRRSLTVAEADALLRAVEADRLGPYFTVMLLLGLRPGEVDALSWEDVDFDAGTLTVRRAMKRASGGQALELGTPKTAKSVRVIKMPARIVEAMKVQKVLQAEERLAAGPGYGLEDDRWRGLAFLSEIGTPMWPSNMRRAFARVCEAAGIAPAVPYELRHSCGSLLIAAGVAAHEVQDLFGHTDGRMLERVYRHRLTPVVDAATAMETILGR
jgi:integrase